MADSKYSTEVGVASQSEKELHAAITNSGQVAREIYRLQLERFTEVLDSFRSTMLQFYEELAGRVEVLEARVAELEQEQNGGEAPSG